MTYIQSTTIDTSKKFSSITIGLASPEMILARSYGEVLKPETINYRSYKPEKDGLFCEKIFGPVKDYECHCGKYKGIRYRGIICDRCGVEVTRKKVRRERMGHITLAVPVVHIWYLRSIPSKLSYLSGKSTKELERVIYYEMFMVIDPGESGLEPFQMIDEDEYLEIEHQHGYMAVSDEDRDNENYFYATMGGEAMKEMLSRMSIPDLKKELVDIVKTSKSKQKRADALKRMKVVQSFVPDPTKKRLNKPEWMIVSILPVIPPELRPLVPLEGGRFAASDLNDLYRRIIIRNNRLKQLMEINAPDVILRNEKRMLQEAVDALLDVAHRAPLGEHDEALHHQEVPKAGNLLPLEGLVGRRLEDEPSKQHPIESGEQGDGEALAQEGSRVIGGVAELAEHDDQPDQGSDHAEGGRGRRHGFQDIGRNHVAFESLVGGDIEGFAQLLAGIAVEAPGVVGHGVAAEDGEQTLLFHF